VRDDDDRAGLSVPPTVRSWTGRVILLAVRRHLASTGPLSTSATVHHTSVEGSLMRNTRVWQAGAVVAALAVFVAGCSSSGSAAGSAPGQGSSSGSAGGSGDTSGASGSASGSASSAGNGSSATANLVAGGTATIVIVHDPGNLDPAGANSTDQTNQFLSPFAYDNPVALDSKGDLQPQVASKWTVNSLTEYVLTIRKDVTCSDGSALTAKTVADDINYVGDPANQSPLIDVSVPKDAKAVADTSASTVTVTLAAPNAFFLQNLATLPLVCDKGLADRSTLATASDGSGPYVLSEAVANDHYTYTLRDGYTWGPGGATTAEKGMPATIVMKVVSDETTAANLLLNGQVNIASVTGADQARLAAAKLFHVDQLLVQGELWFNELKGTPASDKAVRTALTQALDLTTLAKVGSAGKAVTPDGLVPQPRTCKGDTVAGNLPGFDMAAAKAGLDAAGWKAGADGIRAKDGKPLAITLLYADGNLSETDSAAEYAAQQWKQLGADVTLEKKPKDQRNTIMLADNAKTWDVMFLALQVSNPAMAVPFLSGTFPSKGINFGHLTNQTYLDEVAKANAKSGAEGCDNWNAAEEALYKNVDMVPFADVPTPTWGKNITFETSPVFLIPTSLRLHG
jgi:peptide/nickel transport system substrate-binding protein